ncbi:MAG: response regulator [Clostridia bacterium]|nr:response regulator [Clostridia bacterium]
MYSMIVVNDEREFRKGFCQYFPWSEIGFTIANDFSTAQEANEYLQQHAVDVIVTGIKMAGMSGLELIEEEYKRNRGSHFVVVSGYRNFEYARQAMRFGVQHYLLKPIRWSHIKKEFESLRHDLDMKHREMNKENIEEKSRGGVKLKQRVIRFAR